MRIHGGKADRGLAQHRGREVESGESRHKVIALLCLRKDVGNVVALVAPGIHVHRGEKDSEGAVHDDSQTGNGLRDAHARREVVRIGILQTTGITVLTADEDRRSAVLKDEIGICVFDVH